MKLDIKNTVGFISAFSVVAIIIGVVNRHVNYVIEHGTTLYGDFEATPEELLMIPVFRNFAFLMIFGIVIYGLTFLYFNAMGKMHIELTTKKNTKYMIGKIISGILFLLMFGFSVWYYLDPMFESGMIVILILVVNTIIAFVLMSKLGILLRVLKHTFFIIEK